MRLLFASLLIFACTPVLVITPTRAGSTSVVIAEFRTRGPRGGNDEFIELYNNSSSAVSLSGWRVFGSNGSGDIAVRANLSGMIQPHCYYLLVNSNTNGGPYGGGVETGNQTYSIGITDDGGIGILDSRGFVVDQVGLSSGSVYKEGNPLIGSLGDTGQTYKRIVVDDNTFRDTDNNAGDFLINRNPDPRNASSFCSTAPVPNTLRIVSIGNPGFVSGGFSEVFSVKVAPADSSAIRVTGNFEQVGGSSNQVFLDDGLGDDAVARDFTYTCRVFIPASVPGGTKTITVIAADDHQHETTASFSVTVNAAFQCGVERWSIKTGTDAGASTINLQSVSPVTIATMRSWATPTTLPGDARIDPYEKTVYVLNAVLTKYKLESDSDYHLVLEDAQGRTMIAEIPCPCCVGAQSPFYQAVNQTREKFDSRYHATTAFQDTRLNVRITGVGFFDELHGQTGVAPNGIEVHPVLDIAFNVSYITPYIVRAEVIGKKLYVYGLYFTEGAAILINGGKQKSSVDGESDGTIIVSKKAGKSIERGSTVSLQVRLADGTLSEGFSFTRP